MSNDDVNVGRRRVLVAATSAVGAVGAVGVMTPFVKSWLPSAKAKAAGAPVKANISKLEPGAMTVLEWRGKPVYVVKRTGEGVADLVKNNPNLKDPDSVEPQQPDYVDVKNFTRSMRPDLLVLVGICTHLGCAPKFRPDVGAGDLGGDSWYGGFFCPCHGSRFDLSGRVFNGSPASLNLVVPPYRFEGDDILIVGENPEDA